MSGSPLRIPTGTGLGPRGKRFWRSVTTDYDFTRADDLELLIEVCRLLDELEELKAAIAEHGSVVPGSMGQPRPHPALSEMNKARSTLRLLLVRLGLDQADAEMDKASKSGQKAADARWGNVRSIEERRRGAGS